MRHLEDYPKDNYCFIYVMLEDVYEVEVFYYELMKSLLESKALSEKSKKSKRLRDAKDALIGRIKKLKIPVIGEIELSQTDETSYQNEFDDLLNELDGDDTQIIFMLDEFPQTLENIKARHGKNTAEQFLQKCRKQRQTCPQNIRFIYTGSIGLPHVVRGITGANIINDLNTVEVPPLSIVEAEDMAAKILNTYGVAYEPDMIAYLMKRLQWLIPFHLQLALQEVIDIYEEENRTIIKDDIDLVLKRLLHVRNDRYFAQYKERLKKSFPNEKTFDKVIELLNYIAQHNSITKPESLNLLSNTADDYDRIMESLQFDGYILFSEEKNVYQFTSQLLCMWWKKFVAK